MVPEEAIKFEIILLSLCKEEMIAVGITADKAVNATKFPVFEAIEFVEILLDTFKLFVCKTFM